MGPGRQQERRLDHFGAGEIGVWSYVCSAPEEQGSPALGVTSWAGKRAQEFDSEGWRGSPGLPNPLHDRPTMGGGCSGGAGPHKAG